MRERVTSHPSAVETVLSLAAFTATVERWQGPLDAFLRGVVSEPEHARDLTQDAFHAAWRATQRCEPPWTPEHSEDERQRWLFHAAYCRAISHLRRGKVIQWIRLPWRRLAAGANEIASPAADEDWEAVEDHTPPFEQRVVESDALRAALMRLSPDDTAVLLLRVAQGFTTAETAEILGVSEEAMAQRLSRARRRLRAAYLSQNPPDEAPHERDAGKAHSRKERER